MTDFKELQQELKSFYGVNSLEAVAEKMGYKRGAATSWRARRALSNKALLKYIQDKEYSQKEYSQMDNSKEYIEEVKKESGSVKDNLTFKELFEKIGLNQTEVAKLLEKSQKQVSNYINEVTKPDNYIMERMLNIAKHKALIEKPEGTDFKELQQELKSFYGVNSLEAVAEKMGYTKASATNWRRNKALTAQAELEFIRAKNEKNMLEKNIFYSPNTPPMKQIEAEVIIPYYKDFSVSAGFGSLNFDGEVEMLPFNKNELRAMFGISNFNKMGIISVIGDSMHPTLKEGQMLLFQEDGSSIEGAIYIIEYQNELFVKRLKKRPLSLVSDNKEYSNIEIKELQELKIIGRVVGAYEIVYQRL